MIVVENLKHLVLEHKWDPDQPHYLGHTLHHSTVPFNAGGIYVLSRGALRLYGAKLPELVAMQRVPYTGKNECVDVETQDEDVMLGICLKSLGVTPTDTHDAKGRDAFFNFRVAGMGLRFCFVTHDLQIIIS